MSIAKLFVPAGTFVQCSFGAILEPVHPNLLNSVFCESGPPSRNSGLVMVNGWSALREATATWDVRENESRSDRARRRNTSMPVPITAEIFRHRGFAKRSVIGITITLLHVS